MANVFAAGGSLYLFAVAWPLSRVDIREHRLPNKYVLPTFPITFFGFFLSAVLSNSWLQLFLATFAALVIFAVALLANRFGSLGMGDVKLIAAMTLSLAWFSLLSPMIALVLAFVLAAMVILIRLMLRRTNLKESIALGPYLLAAFVVTQILTWSSYFGGFTPHFFM